MDWYIVTKTIRGNKYLYWQKTQRLGKQVKTYNKYIGPAGSLYSAPNGNKYIFRDEDMRLIPKQPYASTKEKELKEFAHIMEVTEAEEKQRQLAGLKWLSNHK